MKILSAQFGLLTAIVLASSNLSSIAQTVGNGTVIAPSSVIIQPSAGQREFASMNASNGTSSQDSGVGAYATRHYTRGERSGIGGSFIGTASPTSESSRAAIVNLTPKENAPQFRLPNLDSTFGSINSTPASQTYNPDLPKLPRQGGLVNPFEPLSSMPENSHFGLEPLPSFNSQPSFMQKTQFDQFGNRF